MNPERWRVVKALFAELSELPAADRSQRLAAVSFGDVELREEVAALLAAADEVGDRFERIPGGPLLVPEMGPGTLVGPYRILRELGHGGMGSVYEAVRVDGDFDKRVALKMVSAGRDTAAILRRFRYERQILARLEHRNIAALLDGGVTADGQPYFAMEFVDGVRIDEYCDQRRLGVADRLRLVRQVCGAVHYAHQNLVVHRDIKPGNVLVTSDGTVKLLDFGIAKLLAPGDDDEWLTRTGVAPMTTAYASPEQLEGGPITTASDTYSLGVLLYELLAGRPPFPAGNLPPLEVRRRMLESDPIPPSRVATVEAVSSAAEPSTRRLQRTLAGELDNVVLMALRKEPERRYPSVEALGEDLLRFLAGLPIQATPDSWGYRFRKAIRRNRLAALAAAVAIVAVLGGTVVSVWQATVARRAQAVAEREQRRATAVADFFRSVFEAANPIREGPRVTVLEAMDAATGRIDSAFADDLWTRTALKSAIGSTLHDMGLLDRAEPLLRDAVRLQSLLDDGAVTYAGATAVYDLAMVEMGLGRLTVAESLFRVSMRQYEAIPGIDQTDLADGWGQVAIVVAQLGRQAESLELQRKALDLLRATARPDDRGLAIAIGNYATALTEVGRLDEARPLHQESIALLEARDPNDPAAGALMQPLAVNLLYAGRLAEAESVARRSHAVVESLMGPTAGQTMVALRGLLSVLVERGACAEVAGRARGVIALRGTALAETDLSLGSAYLVLGQCLSLSGDHAGAVAAVREAKRLRGAVLPPTHWAMAQVESILGETLVRGGHTAEGRTALRRGWEGLDAALGAEHYRTRQAKARLDR